MAEPQQQQAEDEATFQCMDPDLISAMKWELLLEITRHMDTADRSSWRLVSMAALQAVYDSATALAPCSDSRYGAAALLPQLLAKCSGLKQLSCRDLRNLNSIAGLLQLPLRLEALDISYTDVMDLSFIARCSSLKRLTAACVPGCAGPASCQLAAVLQQLPGLTALNLHGNKLHVDAALGVAAVLQNLTGLEELGIGGTGEDASDALLQAVPHLTGLRRLSLLDCHLADQDLLPAIAQLTRLQRLNLSYNCLRAEDALALAPALLKLPHLEVLELADCYLPDEGIIALAPVIQQLTGLTVLDLGTTEFRWDGNVALAPALRHLTRLQELHLPNNRICANGAALLAPSIQELTGLRRLDLHRINLCAEGAEALAPALQRLTLLQHLDLSYNYLTPAGLAALLPGVQQLVSLRNLFLECNGLDREGMLSFAAGIHQLSRLEELNVYDEQLDEGFVVQTLAQVIHTSSPGCKVTRETRRR